MSVSELREWLKRFEKKHQEHFQQGQVVRRRSPIQTGRRLSVRDDIFGLPQPDANGGATVADENHLQQENNQPNLTSKEPSSKRFGNTNDSQEENQHPSSVNQVAAAEDETLKKLGKLAIPSPPFNDEVTPTSSQGLDSFEHERTNEGFPNDLCLALSAVTVATSSSSVEVEASESVASKESLQIFDMDSGENIYQQPPKELVAQPGHKTKHQKPKPVPAAWSDFEPIDFDASYEDSFHSEKEKEDGLASSKTWPTWTGDARQYLKKQSIPSFQGYWSDKECDEDDEDNDADDDNSVATGRKTEPPRSRYNRARTYRRGGKIDDAFTMMETQEEDSPAPFSLFDVARSSMASDKAPSRPMSLSEHFIVGTKNKSSKTKGTRSDSPANQSMYSANLFQNKTMTAGALDVICNGKVSSSAQNETSSKLETFFERGDQGTVSSWSLDSGKPSVAPNAVDPKLSKLFSSNVTSDNTKRVVAREVRQPEQMTKRSTVGEMREAAPSPDPKPTCVVAADTTTVTNTKGMATSGEISPTSSFTSVLEKFGGGGRRQSRKTRIQRQTEALEEHWANDRKVKLVKKLKWQPCRSSGAYKQILVLDVEDK